MGPTWSRSATSRGTCAAGPSRGSKGCSATVPSASASPSSTAYPTEVACLAALVEQAQPGDVVGLMCHAERQQVYDWIAERGGTGDTPQQLGEKVRAARA